MARPSLTRAHRVLLGLVAAGACLISGIGFAGSYNAVRDLATAKGFGLFAYAFPIGVDAGIVVLLALDLVLTWLRIPFPLLRQTAWLLTVATIAFNAAASWGDPLGMGMHAVIPVLFVVVVEASRHAVGRIAAITADRHMESVRMLRWLLSPVPTFRLWRRMKLWELRSYDEVVRLEQNRLVYRAQLRFRYGRGWRRSAPIQALLPLKLAKYGMPLDLGVLDRLDAEARELAEAREAKELQEARRVAAEQQFQAAIPAAVPVAAAVPVPVPVAVGGQAEDPEQVAPAVSAVAAELAVPTLAKLASLRLRDAQEPAQAEESAPVPARDELNVWTERAVRAHAPQGGMEATGRVPGQASPWFKPPRPGTPQPVQQPTRPVAEVRREAVRPAEAEEPGMPDDQWEPDPRDADSGLRELRPRESAQRESGLQADRLGLDPELCYDALVSYIDTYEDHPDPQRLAEYLTEEFGVVGNRPDGSVSTGQVDKLWPALRARYASAGRD